MRRQDVPSKGLIHSLSDDPPDTPHIHRLTEIIAHLTSALIVSKGQRKEISITADPEQTTPNTLPQLPVEALHVLLPRLDK
jgi:hypothetical protein